MSTENEFSLDSLSEREALFCDDAIKVLNGQAWARPLLDRVQHGGGLRSENKSTLFELRFALALHRAGVAPDYEIAGEGESTIDFGFDYHGRLWRVELMRLEETQAVREATHVYEEDGVTWFERTLSSKAKDKRQTEEGETSKAVQRICQKCEKDGRPSKFLLSDNCINLLLVDFRTCLNGGDIHDRVHVGLGGEYVRGEFNLRFWNCKLISGVFGQRTKVHGAEYARQRLHFLGFVNERDFAEGAFSNATQFIANPHLFKGGPEAQSEIERWPLQPASLINRKWKW